MSDKQSSSQGPSLEQQVQAAYQQYQLIESQLAFYQEQFQTLSQLFTELSLSISTLKGLKESSTDNEILIPIGSGAYVWARIENKEQVLTLVGAHVHVEKSIDDAIQTIEGRKAKVENSLKQLTNETQRLASERDRIRQFIEQVAAQRPSGNQ